MYRCLLKAKSLFKENLIQLKQYIKRLCRYVQGNDWFPSYDINPSTGYFGSQYGGWTVACDFLSNNSVTWCVGIGEDISFDLALQKAFKMKIDAFDPTPRSLKWLKTQDLPKNFFVHAFGIAQFDGSAQFLPPSNSNHVSHTLNMSSHSLNQAAIICEVRRLETLAAMLNVEHIDLMKLDIEGAEYSVIDDICSSKIAPRQLLVEFHHRFDEYSINNTKAAVRKLRNIGYQLFHVSPNGEEYSFLSEHKAH